MRTDLKNMHERYNCKMRWETAGKKENKFGDLSGNSYPPYANHNKETEICKVNWKSQPELTSADVGRIDPSKLPSSDDCNGKIGTVTVADTDCRKYKIAMAPESGETKISKGDDTGRNETALVTENNEKEVNVIVPNKGRENEIKIANGVSVTEREKDFSKRQDKGRDLLDDESSDEDRENECAEHQEVTKTPVLNINILPDSVSDVENQLKNLAITQSGGDKGDLCERSPMGNERHRVRSDPPYPQVSSKLRCNGGGIVAESLAPTDCLYGVSPSAIVHFNINDLSEPNNNLLLQSATEFPFGEESSLPEPNNNFLQPSSRGSLYGEESCPLPDLGQEDLDIYLNCDSNNVDKGRTENTEGDTQLGDLGVRDDLSCFNLPNMHPEQNELCPDAAWPIPLSISLPYRKAESIASLSSPSSGSRYSSECSPSSSPVPSLADSVTGKSDSDFENELWKIESNLQKVYGSLSDVQSCSAQCVNDRSLNKLVSSSVGCGHPCYPLALHPSMNFQPSESAIRLRLVQPAQSVITMQSVQPANPVVSVQSATSMQLHEPARGLQLALPANCLQPAQSLNCLHPAQSASRLQPAQSATSMQLHEPARGLQLALPANCLQSPQSANCLQPAQSLNCLHPAQSASHLQPAQSANCLQPAQSLNCLQPAQSASRLQLAQSANCLQPAQSASRLQPAQSANCLQPAQSASRLQPAQSANCLQPAQSANCLQPAQRARGMQQAQLAVGLWHTQPATPAISVQPGLRNIQLTSSTNTQAVIIQSNVQPFTCMPPQQPNIQRGPVIPETVAVSARERMAAEVDKAVKDCVVMTLAKLTDDQLSKGDEHGDTQLMILIANQHQHKLEQIYVMVSMLKNISGALVARNAQNQSALSLASMFLHHTPFVARFIAEVMLEKGLPVNEVYEEGNTLLHILCAKGDSHVDVLAELLSMKDHNSAPCFDINQHNYREGTPLHVAVKMHSKKVNCSRTIAFLLSQGADVLAQERSGGLTALHMAIKESCDPLLVQLLLQAAERRNINLEIQKIIHKR